jgi:hypothetical protein
MCMKCSMCRNFPRKAPLDHSFFSLQLLHSHRPEDFIVYWFQLILLDLESGSALFAAVGACKTPAEREPGRPRDAEYLGNINEKQCRCEHIARKFFSEGV